MKVLNLQCQLGHGFEGWFASEDDFQSQRERGLVSCPLCGDAQIAKLPSAPRLNLSSNRGETLPSADASHEPASAETLPATTAAAKTEVMPAALQHMQAALMQAVRHVLANTEDVGTQFADEARKMHYGETQERGIRGQVTREETEALLDEGIEVMPLPMIESLKGPLQ